MPRAKANPDPHVESYTPTRGSGAGREFTIKAWRTGTFEVFLGGQLLDRVANDLHQSRIGKYKWPSNWLQEDALARAKAWLEGMSRVLDHDPSS